LNALRIWSRSLRKFEEVKVVIILHRRKKTKMKYRITHYKNGVIILDGY
jgi:hypothetical protein